MKLEALKTWRAIEDGEFVRGEDECVPAVVIYTRKRADAHGNQKFKARLVALGNRQSRGGDAEIFAPTISGPANRYTLLEGAARGYFLGAFDISNAFCRAELRSDQRIFLRLPKRWSSNPKGDIVRLEKSLYGLRLSPRVWFDKYKGQLEKLGWTMCKGKRLG